MAQLRLTTMGRQLRLAGVQKILKSLDEDGWIAFSMPIATLVNKADEDVITEDNAADLDYRVIDGNHRVAVLLKRDETRKTSTNISVRVHKTMGNRAERIVADRE